MKSSYLFTQKYPIPDQITTVHAIRAAAQNHKWSLDSPFTITFMGIAVIHLFFFLDPFNENKLSDYLSWAVCLVTIITVLILLVQNVKKLNYCYQQLHECYRIYLTDSIHSSYQWELENYQECLRELKKIHFEKAHLSTFAQHYYKDELWDEHIRKFGPTSILDTLWDTKRGEKLKVNGFFPFYYEYQDHYSLLQLYHEYLTLDEIRKFLSMYRQLKSSFIYKPDAEAIKKASATFEADLKQEEEELILEMEEIYTALQTMENERKACYLSFKEKYLELTKDIEEKLPAFTWAK